MSPDPDIAMDTSGVVPGEHDQALDTEKIEIIASTLEEICTFLNQAPHLIVSSTDVYDICATRMGALNTYMYYTLICEVHV